MTIRMRTRSGEARRTTYCLDDFLPPLPSTSSFSLFLFFPLSLPGHVSFQALGSGQRQQVVGDHSQPYPTFHSLRAAIATAGESVASFEGTDAPFASRAPAHRPSEPALRLMRPAGCRQASPPRQRHAAHPACRGCLFVGRRTEGGIGGGQVRRASEDRWWRSRLESHSCPSATCSAQTS